MSKSFSIDLNIKKLAEFHKVKNCQSFLESIQETLDRLTGITLKYHIILDNKENYIFGSHSFLFFNGHATVFTL